MQKNTLYLIIGALAVVVVGLAFYVWDKERQPEGVEIRLEGRPVSLSGWDHFGEQPTFGLR